MRERSKIMEIKKRGEFFVVSSDERLSRGGYLGMTFSVLSQKVSHGPVSTLKI
jgi:hypothetical protein